MARENGRFALVLFAVVSAAAGGGGMYVLAHTAWLLLVRARTRPVKNLEVITPTHLKGYSGQ